MVFLKATSKTTENDSTSSLLLIVKRPVGVGPGDLLIAHIASVPGVQITAAPGWSYLSADTLMGDQICCYSRIAEKSEPEDYRWSFTPRDVRASLEIRAFSGLTSPWARRVRRWLGFADPHAEDSAILDGGQPIMLDENHFKEHAFAQPLMPEDVKVRSVSRSEAGIAPKAAGGGADPDSQSRCDSGCKEHG